MVFDMKEIDTVKSENNNRVIRFNNEEKSILSFSKSSSLTWWYLLVNLKVFIFTNYLINFNCIVIWSSHLFEIDFRTVCKIIVFSSTSVPFMPFTAIGRKSNIKDFPKFAFIMFEGSKPNERWKFYLKSLTCT